MRARRPSGLWTDALISLAVLALFSGCDEEAPTPDEGEPSLTIVASNACGRNLLPVATNTDLLNGTIQAVDVVVTGTDPTTDTRQLVAGTEVVLRFTDNSDGKGFFVSSRRLEQRADGTSRPAYEPISRDISFLGRSARDQFFCTELGTVNLTAEVLDYRPGGTGLALASLTPQRPFPIRCVSREEFLRACGLLDASVPLADQGPQPDLGPEVDLGEPIEVDGGVVNPWTLRFEGCENPEDCTIGIRNSGGNLPDNVVLSFRVAEADLPVAGVPVAFRVTASATRTAPAGLSVRPEPSRTAEWQEILSQYPAAAYNGDPVAVTDADGRARVRIVAGGTPGTFAVRATAFRDDGDPATNDWEVDISRSLLVLGGVPSGRGMQLVCADPIVPAYSQRDWVIPSELRNGGAVGNPSGYQLANEDGTTCRVQLADRLNGRVDQTTRVFFMTEAGTVTQQAEIDDEGGATTLMRVGSPPPRDVDPAPWEVEFTRTANVDGCEQNHNPRDGLVRVVAFTRGEEDFRDMDGDGRFTVADVQEPGMDLGEPFVDADDNGWFTERLKRPPCFDRLPAGSPLRDADPTSEQFRDTDGNGFWTEPNGSWDASTDIWVSTTVLWTGNLRADLDVLDPDLSAVQARCGPRGCRAGCAGPGSFELDAGGQLDLIGNFTDDNGNCLGGRGNGRVNLALPADMLANGFLQASISGSWCAAGFERPRGRAFEWSLFNNGAQRDPEADLSIDSVTVDLTYEGVYGTQYQRSWGLTICR